MASYVKELRTRELSVDPALTLEREYLVRGPEDEIEAERVLLEKTPETISLPRRDPLFRGTYSVSEKGPKWWEAKIKYAEAFTDVGGVGGQETLRLSFGVQTETVHITQALKTIGRYPQEGKDAQDYYGVIGQTHDLEAAGCDILTAKLSFNITVFCPQAYVTYAWVRGLSQVVGHPNDAPWKEFGTGEVMCLGVSGAYRQLMRDWELSYSFLVSPTMRDLEIMGLVPITEKIGFDYLWVRYEKVAIDDGKVIVQRPIQANVERVYTFADYSFLGL